MHLWQAVEERCLARRGVKPIIEFRWIVPDHFRENSISFIRLSRAGVGSWVSFW